MQSKKTPADAFIPKFLDESLREWDDRLRPGGEERAVKAPPDYAIGPAQDYESEYRFRHKNVAHRPSWVDILEILKPDERRASLTSQLLAFGRKKVVKFDTLNLNEVTAELQSMLRRRIGEHITLVFQPAKTLGLVNVDRRQIEQVIVALAVNAQAAMPNGGTLTIRMEDVEPSEDFAARYPGAKPGSYIMIEVSDTGSGIDSATLARNIEPFCTTKELGRGTGLGLSTVFGIVKQSDGHISVNSEKDRGTAFKVFLPRVAEQGGSVKPKPARISHDGGETVLIVEDEGALRKLSSRILRDAGYSVLTAENGEEALRVLRANERPVNLLFTDVVMPSMSGLELATRLCEIDSQTKVLFTSGYIADPNLCWGQNEDTVQFIAKPYSVVELTQKVRWVLDSKG